MKRIEEEVHKWVEKEALLLEQHFKKMLETFRQTEEEKTNLALEKYKQELRQRMGDK